MESTVHQIKWFQHSLLNFQPPPNQEMAMNNGQVLEALYMKTEEPDIWEFVETKPVLKSMNEQKYSKEMEGTSGGETEKGSSASDPTQEGSPVKEEKMKGNTSPKVDQIKSLKRKPTKENDCNVPPQKIRATMVTQTYPVGSKIIYYSRFRQQIRQQQRLRGYVNLHQGKPTLMGKRATWELWNDPRDNLRPGVNTQSTQLKTNTWKLVMLMNEPEGEQMK